MIFRQFQIIDESKISIQAVADISGAIPLGQQLQVIPSEFVPELVDLAIETSRLNLVQKTSAIFF